MPLGIPHSVFLGRSVGWGDSQWTDADRGYALAWKRNKAATCACGTRHDEWQADPNAYISDHVYCEGHARLAEEQENIPKDKDGRPMAGYFAFLTPREQYRPQVTPTRRH